MKFTPKGGRVEVRLAEVEGDAQIEVIDTGIGISAEFLPFVFDRFRQADSSMSRRHSGLGLGMAIVRHLVELHGGTVSVESAGENQGTTFRLRLSRATPAPAPEAPAQTLRAFAEPAPGVGARSPRRRARPDRRRRYRFTQRARGACCNGSARWSRRSPRRRRRSIASAHRRPDVLVSDIGMPDEDGYSLIRRLRQMGGERKLPAIALTAYARKQDADAALGAGYDRHLPKPVAPADLIRAIKSVTLEITNSK